MHAAIKRSAVLCQEKKIRTLSPICLLMAFNLLGDSLSIVIAEATSSDDWDLRIIPYFSEGIISGTPPTLVIMGVV